MDLTRSTIWVILSKVGGKLVSFVGIIIFAQFLTPTELGIFFLFQMALGLLAIPADFGRGHAVVKRISEGDNPPNILATSAVILIFSSLVIVSVLLLVQDYVNSYLGAELSVYLAIGIVLLSIYKLPMNILKGELRVNETALLNTAYRFSWVVLGLIFVVVFGFDFHGLVYAVLAAHILIAVIGIYRISTPLGTPSWRSAKSLLRYWIYTPVSYVDSILYNWLDIALIGFFLTQADVGVYEIAWRVAGVVLLVSSAIEMHMLPRVSDWDARDMKDEIENVIPNVITASLYFAIPAFFGSLLLSREGLSLIFGAEYGAAWLVLIVFMAGKIIESFDRVTKNILTGLDYPDLRMRAVLVSITLNIVLNIILILTFGIIGAAVATTVSFTASTLITTYYLHRKIPFSLPINNLAWSVVASGAMLLTLLAVKQIIAVDDLLSLIAVVSLGVVVYLAVSMMYRPLREGMLHVIRTARSQGTDGT